MSVLLARSLAGVPTWIQSPLRSIFNALSLDSSKHIDRRTFFAHFSVRSLIIALLMTTHIDAFIVLPIAFYLIRGCVAARLSSFVSSLTMLIVLPLFFYTFFYKFLSVQLFEPLSTSELPSLGFNLATVAVASSAVSWLVFFGLLLPEGRVSANANQSKLFSVFHMGTRLNWVDYIWFSTAFNLVFLLFYAAIVASLAKLNASWAVFLYSSIAILAVGFLVNVKLIVSRTQDAGVSPAFVVLFLVCPLIMLTLLFPAIHGHALVFLSYFVTVDERTSTYVLWLLTLHYAVDQVLALGAMISAGVFLWQLTSPTQAVHASD